jgi:hypothetical protein
MSDRTDRALASYLGRHDPGFTLRTYVHLMPSADDRMRQAVDAVFASSDGPETARGSAEHRHLGHMPPGPHVFAGRSRAGA